MNKKDALNASTKLTATYEQLYIIYKQGRGEIENSFLKNSNYIEFFKNKREHFEAFFDYIGDNSVAKEGDNSVAKEGYLKVPMESLLDGLLKSKVKENGKTKTIKLNIGDLEKKIKIPTPNAISQICKDKERRLQKAQFIKLAVNKYLAITSCNDDCRIWLPICENNFLKVMDKVFKIDKDCSELFYLPFFSVVNSEVFASGILKAKFDDELFEDISLNAAKAYKIIVGGPLPAVNTPSATSSAMMYAAPSPVKLASPTMAFFTQNLTSNPITLIDFKEKIAIKIQDKTLHVMGLFSDKLIEFLKECKHILNKNKKDEILLVSPNAKEDEETTAQILTFYSMMFMLNPNFINDLFHPKM